MNMRSGEESYSKMCQSLEVPQRIVHKPNLNNRRQDTTNFEARASVDHLSREYAETRSGEYGETRCGNIDFRIQGLPHSIVQQQDDTRREAVKKLIHQFETHPNRKALKADLENYQAFNPFSEESKDMISSMENTEYFECTVPQLFNILDDRRSCILYLRNMLATLGQKLQIKQRSD